jgi:hypothetical protein
MIKEDKDRKNKRSITKYIKIKSCEDFASMSFSCKINAQIKSKEQATRCSTSFK